MHGGERGKQAITLVLACGRVCVYREQRAGWRDQSLAASSGSRGHLEELSEGRMPSVARAGWWWCWWWCAALWVYIPARFLATHLFNIYLFYLFVHLSGGGQVRPGLYMPGPPILIYSLLTNISQRLQTFSYLPVRVPVERINHLAGGGPGNRIRLIAPGSTLTPIHLPACQVPLHHGSLCCFDV